MLSFVLWYLAITLLGWLTFPLLFRLLPGLPDRGYTISRALGWLLWGYLFWILGSLGIAQNDLGGELLALALLGGAVGWALRGEGLNRVTAWVRERGRFILAAELVFLIAFALWAFVRATNPEITGTEKPMELAFINAILRSPGFPPSDPWLSGYAISYYYFGYVLVAMLARLTGTVAGVAFNLAISLIFGLTALSAYGLVYNLLAVWRRGHPSEAQEKAPLGLPLLGPFFTLIVSNLEGFLEVLHARGVFWPSGFWSWFGIQEITQPPATPYTWMPNRPGGIVWWRASRVLQDFTFSGTSREVIDEFPFFSYLLADLHPHVLGMPFALAMIGLALNLYLSADREGFNLLGWKVPISRATFLFYAVALGGLAFMNTWDFPIYLALVSGAYVLANVGRTGWSWGRAGDFVQLALALGVAGGVLYLPFYVGFSSQAGGVLPSLVYFTRGGQFWIMFAPLVLPLFGMLLYLLRRSDERPAWGKAAALTALVVGGLWAAMYVFAFLISQLPQLGSLFMDNIQASGASILEVIKASLTGQDVPGAGFIAGRLTAPGTWLSLAVLLGLALAFLLGRTRRAADREPAEEPPSDNGETQAEPSGTHFWVLLVLAGALLVLSPEFFYLRDQFGTRMNTIFKFYYQAWLIWGSAAAFACAVLLIELRQVWAGVFRVGLAALLAMGLAYPVFSLWIKTDGFHPQAGLTLDGTAYIARYNPDEAAAIAWLRAAPRGVIAEAVGGSYSSAARISANTGDPAVLGWVGHEVQWRGGATEMGSRQPDIELLYQSADWNTTQAVLQKYAIRYVVVGPLERSMYRVDEQKLQQYLPVAFQEGQVTVYQAPDYATPPAVAGTGTTIGEQP